MVKINKQVLNLFVILKLNVCLRDINYDVNFKEKCIVQTSNIKDNEPTDNTLG